MSKMEKEKKKESKEKAKVRVYERLVEEQAKINKQVKQEKILEEKGLLKDPRCSNVSSKGGRCKNSVGKVGQKCTIHEKTEVRKSGKKTQCTSVRTNGKRCKMQTSNKSGYSYYHDYYEETNTTIFIEIKYSLCSV